MKNSIVIRTVLAVAALAAVTCAALDYAYFLPEQQKLLRRNVMEKARAISVLYGASLTKSIESNDDISLLIQIDNIMKLEDISAVFVVDNTGKVLMHNKPSEWGLTYTNDLIVQAISAKRQRWVATDQMKGFLYSTPLTSSSTLCVGISSQKNDELYASIRRTTIILSVLAVVLITAVMLAVIYGGLRKPFTRLHTMLNSLILAHGGTIEPQGPAEFVTTIELINKLVQETHSRSAITPSINDLLQPVIASIDAAVVVIDAENRICAVSEKASALLAVSSDMIGNHILDVFKSSIILNAIQSAQSTPGTPVHSNHNGHPVTIKALPNKQATIIVG